VHESEVCPRFSGWSESLRRGLGVFRELGAAVMLSDVRFACSWDFVDCTRNGSEWSLDAVCGGRLRYSRRCLGVECGFDEGDSFADVDEGRRMERILLRL